MKNYDPNIERERLYQCLTCRFTEICNLDESAEDDRGMCKQYQKDESIEKKIKKWISDRKERENERFN